MNFFNNLDLVHMLLVVQLFLAIFFCAISFILFLKMYRTGQPFGKEYESL
jgi:hypothetical protein